MVIKFFIKTLNQQNTNREKREPHTSGDRLVYNYEYTKATTFLCIYWIIIVIKIIQDS